MTRRIKQHARLRQTVREIHAGNAHIPPDEIQKIVDQANREVRAERRRQRPRGSSAANDDNKNALVVSPTLHHAPTPFTPAPKAAQRLLGFFTPQINNDHTRKAYLNATRRFAGWCDAHGIGQLADVSAFHVAALLKELQGQLSPPTVKQHLAAQRILFDESA